MTDAGSNNENDGCDARLPDIPVGRAEAGRRGYSGKTGRSVYDGCSTFHVEVTIMTTVLVTRVFDSELGETKRKEFDDLAAANDYVDRLRPDGVVGCVKVGDKIKRVF